MSTAVKPKLHSNGNDSNLVERKKSQQLQLQQTNQSDFSNNTTSGIDHPPHLVVAVPSHTARSTQIENKATTTTTNSKELIIASRVSLEAVQLPMMYTETLVNWIQVTLFDLNFMRFFNNSYFPNNEPVLLSAAREY